jgi:hypothetical protein
MRASSRISVPMHSGTAVLAAVLAGSIAMASAMAQSPRTPPNQQSAKSAAVASAAPYRPDRFAGRAGTYYRLIWGVDSLSVKSVESGEAIRFTYRVVDPNKARALNDDRNEPTLIDPKAGVQLVVPQMEKIGKLRQVGAPEAGKSYWMAFSNRGRPVKRGDHVIVQIGQFRADGLVVD